MGNVIAIMKIFRLTLGALSIISLGACGGIGDIIIPPGGGAEGPQFLVSPMSITLDAGASTTIQVTAVEYPVSSFNFNVTEGTSGGTVVQDSLDQSKALYTAPSTPGTFHVVAGFTSPPSLVYAKTVTITVR